MSEDTFIATRFISQISEQSFYKIITSGLKKKVLRPWMKVREIDLIKTILEKHKPKHCLEWGTGYSTLFFPKYLDSDAKWISIEHEKEWFKKIVEANNRKNVVIHLVAPDNYPWSDPFGDGSYSDLSGYINFPEQFGTFDFILVDGRARVECIKKASTLLSDKGIVVLHDANRKRYEEPWSAYRFQSLFRDYRDIVGGFWIGSHNVDINSLFDVEWQKNLWDMYRKIGETRFGNILRI